MKSRLNSFVVLGSFAGSVFLSVPATASCDIHSFSVLGDQAVIPGQRLRAAAQQYLQREEAYRLLAQRIESMSGAKRKETRKEIAAREATFAGKFYKFTHLNDPALEELSEEERANALGVAAGSLGAMNEIDERYPLGQCFSDAFEMSRPEINALFGDRADFIKNDTGQFPHVVLRQTINAQRHQYEYELVLPSGLIITDYVGFERIVSDKNYTTLNPFDPSFETRASTPEEIREVEAAVLELENGLHKE